MAENEELNEFKNLEENNLIDQKELTNDTIESASRQMEEGKNSTAELRKAIDRDAILEEAKKNELYSNMQEICQRMRVDIDGQLIDINLSKNDFDIVSDNGDIFAVNNILDKIIKCQINPEYY